jgi:hypothetical protein
VAECRRGELVARDAEYRDSEQCDGQAGAWDAHGTSWQTHQAQRRSGEQPSFTPPFRGGASGV